METLLLDGLWARGGRFRRIIAAIETAGGTAEEFRYDTSGWIKIETLGERLAAEVRRRRAPVALVGFSMGGLVLRAAKLADPDLPVRRAVFINSPLRGSLMAYAGIRPGTRQMRPTSPLIRRLSAAPWDVPTLAIWCPLDGMVLPGSSARFEQAAEVALCHVPLHLWPLYSRKLARRVAGFLTADAQEPEGSTAAAVPEV
jgi:pimeloyl-ACP methyl ester carboxylesterase